MDESKKFPNCQQRNETDITIRFKTKKEGGGGSYI